MRYIGRIIAFISIALLFTLLLSCGGNKSRIKYEQQAKQDKILMQKKNAKAADNDLKNSANN